MIVDRSKNWSCRWILKNRYLPTVIKTKEETFIKATTIKQLGLVYTYPFSFEDATIFPVFNKIRVHT